MFHGSIYGILYVLLFLKVAEGTPDRYITCEFDLENIEKLLEYLPQKCQEMYVSRLNNDSKYDLYLTEAQHFSQFYSKLRKYELRNEPNGTEDLNQKELPFESALRKQIYEEKDWSGCIQRNNNYTDVMYLECLIKTRNDLTELVPEISKSN